MATLMISRLWVLPIWPFGIMVYTTVSVNGVTREMCLPVMDASNKPLKDHDYTIKMKSGEKSIPAATMFDINRSIMRCLAKNCAMFGIGLHLWMGEDVPEAVSELEDLRDECFKLLTKKVALSEKAKAEVAKLCTEADKNANGDPRLIEDIEVLKTLKKQLAGVRK